MLVHIIPNIRYLLKNYVKLNNYVGYTLLTIRFLNTCLKIQFIYIGYRSLKYHNNLP